MQLFD